MITTGLEKKMESFQRYMSLGMGRDDASELMSLFAIQGKSDLVDAEQIRLNKLL